MPNLTYTAGFEKPSIPPPGWGVETMLSQNQYFDSRHDIRAVSGYRPEFWKESCFQETKRKTHHLGGISSFLILFCLHIFIIYLIMTFYSVLCPVKHISSNHLVHEIYQLVSIPLLLEHFFFIIFLVSITNENHEGMAKFWMKTTYEMFINSL